MEQMEKEVSSEALSVAEESQEKKKPERYSGILVHPTSFPSPYGIGDLGKGAYDFIDFLASSGQKIWQVLPLGPTGFGDSPYQTLSAFAGQPYIISPDKLREDGLLTDADLKDIPRSDPRQVDYGEVIPYKMGLLHKAYDRFTAIHDQAMEHAFSQYIEKEKYWLEDYALFMATKDYYQGRCWLDWEEGIREGKEFSKVEYTWMLKEQIRFYEFLQFLFDRQWHQLRKYAAEKKILIIGDIPIFMSIDCADVWADKSLFKLDSTGHPLEVAGVPPDYFSATGQLWGNPLYDWDEHEKTGYDWWIRRVKRQKELVDLVRIDHFRGFESYWAIPAGEKTAINGEWKPGPGEKLFLRMQEVFGKELPIIAEDLGIITAAVDRLRDQFNLPGMKVLQFGFEDLNDTSYIPHFYASSNCVCYTGTHDNQTTVGWYQHQNEQVKDRVRMYGNCDGGCVSLDFIRFAMSSIAKYAIFPIQDLMQLGDEARMNKPGVAEANWAFRYTEDMLKDWMRDWLLRYSRIYYR